jgi:hypothetical protein
MKKNRNFYEINRILILSIVLTIVTSFFNNANALFHEQELNNEQISDASKEFIVNLFDKVNSVSNEFYQNESDEGKKSVNNNMTIVNKTNEHIGKLEKIILLAKEYDMQEEYQPVLNSYINSLQNEIESHSHYKKYILTGNNTENKLAEDLLSKALNYETEAIKKFNQLK